MALKFKGASIFFGDKKIADCDETMSSDDDANYEDAGFPKFLGDEEVSSTASGFMCQTCADVEAGQVLTLCDCGCVRPMNRPHGWKRIDK